MKKSIAAIMLAALLLIACGCAPAAQNEINIAPAVPDFETHNVKINLKLGETAEYKTATKLDTAQTTLGNVTINEINVFKFADELPDSTLPALEGYEWVEVKASSVFGDDKARELGVDRASCVTNYYDLTYYESHIESAEGSDFTRFSVKPEGSEKSFDECLYTKVIDNLGWNDDRQNVCNYTWYFRIPEGYDGMVIVFFNSAIDWPDGKYVYEVLDADSLVYRVAK